MRRSVQRLTALVAAGLLSLLTSASAVAQTLPQPAAAQPATQPAAAPALTLEQRVQDLESRVQALERLLALTTLDVPNLVEQTAPAVVSLYQVTDDDEVVSRGTGFLWSDEGLIVTNAHVVDDGGLAVKAKFADGRVLVATRVLVDTFLDLAILDVEGTGFPYLDFAMDKPAVGEPVVVIGNAFGYSNSVTYGIVSGVDRPSPYHDIVHYPSLQTDAAINFGNSGGPILNRYGQVVAVATWTEGKGETDSIAFGIPADQVVSALTRLDSKRGIVRPWLGVSIQEPYWAMGGLPNDLGLMVTDLHPLGAGARAGLQRFDRILSVGGKPVNYLLELRQELERYKPGDTILISVERLVGGKFQSMLIPVVAGEYSAVVDPLIPFTYYDPTSDDVF